MFMNYRTGSLIATGLNCEKNAVTCEGYPPRTIWRSGREKDEEAGTSIANSPLSPIQSLMASAALRRVSIPVPNITLAPIIHGIETDDDRIFFEHYIYRLSAVLTVEGPKENAFTSMLLPKAVEHKGLMHSILALSSTNIDFEAPYGRQLLVKNPNITVKQLNERGQYQRDQAMLCLNADIDRQTKGLARKDTRAYTYGQMLCLIVQSIAEGRRYGEHRIHLAAYKKDILANPPEEGPFMEFIQEFFQFHIGLDDIISLPEGRARLGTIGEDWNLPPIIQPEAVRLLGVNDGLWFYLSKITSIRNQIRFNMEQHLEPVVDFTSFYKAVEIDAGIREWSPSWQRDGPTRDLAAALYKQMLWVYLWRTLYPPKTNTWQPEHKITEAVNNGIAVLKLFPPKDPNQTLLLAPTFVIGCAAFEPGQREPIKASVRSIRDYTGLRNADRALEVLEKVWFYMDACDERSWDWQKVAFEMHLDFLAT
jgi:hypothetical protein